MTDVMPRLSAALADRYALERELGAGGMATVFLAEDPKHKRRVAVKVFKPELAAVLGAERFVQEITTTASLSHPHILPLFDSGTADGFLVPPGPTLAPGVPRALFSVAPYRSAQNRQQYDVSPDGRRFLMIRDPRTTGRRDLVYSENWFDDLRRKVPR